jgi:hypothetical protein
MTPPTGNVSALETSHGYVSGSISQKHVSAADGSFFLSAEFLRPYRAEPWVYPFPRPPMAPGELRAAVLHAAAYLDCGLDAQIDGVRHALEVAGAIIKVALGILPGPSEPSLH